MKKSRWMLLPLIAALAMIISASAAQAATFRQTSAGQKTMKFVWDDPCADYSSLTTTSYLLQWGKSSSNYTWSRRLSASSRSAVVTGMSPTKRYYAKLTVYYRNSSGSTGTGSFGELTCYTAPGRIGGITYDYNSSQKGLRMKMNPPSGNYNPYYQIQLRNLSGKKVFSVVAKSNPYTRNSFSYYRRVLRAKVRPFIKLNDKNFFGPWSTKAIVPQPILTGGTAKNYIRNGKMHLAWQKVIGATGYDIYVSKSSDSGYKRVKSVSGSATAVTLTSSGSGSFAVGPTYYVKIRTKAKIGKSSVNYYNSLRAYYTYS